MAAAQYRSVPPTGRRAVTVPRRLRGQRRGHIGSNGRTIPCPETAGIQGCSAVSVFHSPQSDTAPAIWAKTLRSSDIQKPLSAWPSRRIDRRFRENWMLLAQLPVLNMGFCELSIALSRPDHLYCRPSGSGFCLLHAHNSGLIGSNSGLWSLRADLLLRIAHQFHSWLCFQVFSHWPGGARSSYGPLVVRVAGDSGSQMSPAPAPILHGCWIISNSVRRPGATSPRCLGISLPSGLSWNSEGRAVQATAVYRHLARIDQYLPGCRCAPQASDGYRPHQPKSAPSPAPFPRRPS